jgi:hypothetical protein
MGQHDECLFPFLLGMCLKNQDAGFCVNGFLEGYLCTNGQPPSGGEEVSGE